MQISVSQRFPFPFKDKDVANEQIKKLSREKDSLDRHVADMEKEMADMKEQVQHWLQLLSLWLSSLHYCIALLPIRRN